MSEYARRIRHYARTDVVSITKMLRDEIDPKQHQYRCIDETCDVPVFPAIPDKIKPGRARSPSPYFRAGYSRRHADGCMRAAIEVKIRNQKLNKQVPQLGTSNERTRAGLVPVRFIESRPVKTSSGARGHIKTAENPQEQMVRSYGKHGGYTGTSEATTRTMERYADAYENPPASYDKLRIIINGCPAKTFSETFLSPIKGATSLIHTNIRHIYRGQYNWHQYWNSGISVYFQESVNDIPLSVWIPNNLEPTSVLNRILDRLQEAKCSHDAVIYALGKFVLKHGYGKYAIELTSPYQFWIHIPNP